MNAVEIEQAVTELAERPFDPGEFPFAFLEAFGNKATTLARLRRGASNRSDLGGVLQTGNVHVLVAEPGRVTEALDALRTSAATSNKRNRVRFLLATDGRTLEAEDREGGDTVACDYGDFPDHFGFFLPLAGISTVPKIAENAFDIRATSRLNRLYLTLLEENPEWGAAARRHDLNHFLARLIFCFFAEDTDILSGEDLFTATVEQMSDDTNTAWVISEIFRAMNTPPKDRAASGLRNWANAFPYVNGGLFSGSVEVPSFSRIARRYLLHIGRLDWRRINPDIFGSMIQAVADDEERGALGMHYTSVPNILKVLNPLFLDDLRRQLEEAGGSGRKLLNLRKRMARIRVFDPACGSGNFLVIAYKEMRAIEAEANRRRGEADRASDIPLTNFRGIEIRDFSAEIARLALIIAEYQCDVLHRGQKEALAEFLPLDAKNWITCGNALRLDWLAICPPTGTGVKVASDDLFGTPLDQSEIDFENEGGETYICGNPPYLGKGKKDETQLDDMKRILGRYTIKYGYVDYVGCWFILAAEYIRTTKAAASLVATNSLCQGRQLPQLWPHVLLYGVEIFYGHHSFRWSNNASYNAGVTCVIVGISRADDKRGKVIENSEHKLYVDWINPYLSSGRVLVVESVPNSKTNMTAKMVTGSVPNDGGNLILTKDEAIEISKNEPGVARRIRSFMGSRDFIYGEPRAILDLTDKDLKLLNPKGDVARRLKNVSELRAKSIKRETREELSTIPHIFQHTGPIPAISAIVIPSVSSERREWFPAGLTGPGSVISNLAFLIADAPLWNLALIASRIHLVWIATVCGKLKTDFRYSNTLGWNTFPVPALTERNKDDLTACAEAILLTREAHFPATIADLYEPERMPNDLRAAHEANDETLERIYVGRRFRNDTERLEHLFDRYTKMTAKEGAA